MFPFRFSHLSEPLNISNFLMVIVRFAFRQQRRKCLIGHLWGSFFCIGSDGRSLWRCPGLLLFQGSLLLFLQEFRWSLGLISACQTHRETTCHRVTCKFTENCDYFGLRSERLVTLESSWTMVLSHVLDAASPFLMSYQPSTTNQKSHGDMPAIAGKKGHDHNSWK